MRSPVILGALAMLAACDAPEIGEEDDGPDDPYCHWDCFGFHECADGIVTSWEHTPVPCEYWEGECPHAVTYQCVEGCRIDTDRIDDPSLVPAAMCEENRPKQIGDVCVDETDCRPEVATWNELGEVTNVYLRCDGDTGRCVAREPPVISDWLAQCGLVPDEYPESYAYGVAEAALCDSGLCLFVERNDCVAQGCTIACTSDGECPPGAVCDWEVCKPGPPNSIGIDISCP